MFGGESMFESGAREQGKAYRGRNSFILLRTGGEKERSWFKGRGEEGDYRRSCRNVSRGARQEKAEAANLREEQISSLKGEEP